MSEDQATNNAAVSEGDSARDRSSDRSSDRGELSGGRRDRSREMLREELSRNLDDATRRSGRPRDWEPADRPARAAREATAEAKDRGQETAAGGAGAAAQAADELDISAAPKSWRADERAHYDALPVEAKKAVHRDRAAAERGVAELRSKYQAEDLAWAPHEPVIRQFGKSRAETVTQLMSWFGALSRDPVNAFPALVKSMGAEQALLQHAQRMQPQSGAQQTNGGAFDPRVVQHYVDQRVGTLEQQMAEAQQARTNEILENWARGKKYYERVRAVMSDLLMPNPQTGRAIVPLKNGAVDLDESYRQACLLLPDVRDEIQAEERAAERKAESERARQARYTSSSLRPASPGSNSNTGGAKKRGGPTSVRQSLEAAMDELAGR
jgi:hypothetical protein